MSPMPRHEPPAAMIACTTWLINGAGACGLAAAVYAASEGLDVRSRDTFAPAVRPGTSSRIENYLGFRPAFRAQRSAGRALSQAQSSGTAECRLAGGKAFHCDHWPYSVDMADGHRYAASHPHCQRSQYGCPMSQPLSFSLVVASTTRDSSGATLCAAEDSWRRRW